MRFYVSPDIGKDESKSSSAKIGLKTSRRQLWVNNMPSVRPRAREIGSKRKPFVQLRTPALPLTTTTTIKRPFAAPRAGLELLNIVQQRKEH